MFDGITQGPLFRQQHGTPAVPGPDRPHLTAPERLLIRLAQRYTVVYPELSFHFLLDDLACEPIGAGARIVRVTLHNASETCRRIFTGGSLELGNCYCEGLIDVADRDYRHFLLMLVRAVFEPRLRQALPLADRLWLYGTRHRGEVFSRESDFANINSHYSLSDWVDEATSNRFYLAWLDTRHRQYSSGLWLPETATVEDAQDEKFRHYAARLGLPRDANGRTLLELGCGWGGFLFHAAREHGLCARGITLSTAQGRFIADEAARTGISDRVKVTVGNANRFSGRWDHVVAIGLLEHIDHLDDLFFHVARNLAPGGSALFHAMFHEGRFSKPDPWLTRHIFPGGRVPGIDHTLRLLRRYFAVVDREDLPPLSYPKTLRAWHRTFCAKEDELREILAAGGCPSVDLAIRTFKHYLVLAETGLSVDGIVSNIVCREPILQPDAEPVGTLRWHGIPGFRTEPTT